jgi:hypothetical protein
VDGRRRPAELIVVGLMALPYIDTNKAGNGYYTINQRKFAYVTFQFGFLVLWVILILLGTFLRGPNWNFFGPYEYWDLHKLIPLNNVNLSDIVWVQMLGRAARRTSSSANCRAADLPRLLRGAPRSCWAARSCGNTSSRRGWSATWCW